MARRIRMGSPSFDERFTRDGKITRMIVVEVESKQEYRIEVPNNYTEEHYRSMIKDHNSGERNLLRRI